MRVVESRRIRQLVVHADRGEELPAALLRALQSTDARAGWITGAGAVEVAEVAVLDQAERALLRPRRLETPCELVSLAGPIATSEGAMSLRLSATLARETDRGLDLVAGQLVWARCFAVDLHVTVFDDLALACAPEDRAGPAEGGRAPALGGGARPSAEPARAPLAEPPALTTIPLPPQRAARPVDDEEENYPEVGDRVSHFLFGECEVIAVDGDRIRLRQDKGGPIREFALAMLRIEGPTVDPATGCRHFRLLRKS